jgi:hypothetical protein
MAAFQTESGACTGRGFADVNVDGYLAKFKTWVVKAPASGGPGWTILLDRSTNPVPVEITSVDTGTDIFTKVDHGFYTGEYLMYETTGSAMGGITHGDSYFIRKINDDTFTLHTERGQATTLNASKRNITSAGSGTHTLTLCSPYIMISPSVPASVNEVVKIIKVGYYTSAAGYVTFQSFLSWDDTNKIARGMWMGLRVNTVDSGDFAYNFRGGDECIAIFSRITTSWTYALVDEWDGITAFVEDTNVTGTFQSLVSAGTDVVVQLDTGEASLFIVDHWYYMYDFNDRNLVNYVKVTARDTGLDTITLQQVWNEFTIGGVIAAYAHRFYSYGSTNDVSSYGAQIPYCSDNPNEYVFYGQMGNNLMTVDHKLLGGFAYVAQPDDNDLYACMRPIITEKYCNYVYASRNYQYMNRQYGKLKNMFRSYGSMAQMLDYRVINSLNYLKIDSSTSVNILFLHSTSLS